MEIIEKNDFIIGNSKFSIVSDEVYSHHLGNEFEPHTSKLITAFSNKYTRRGEDNAIDVGANIGMTSILMSSLYRNVYSFEPAPGTYSLLEENIKRNNITNIVLYNLGLGDSDFDSTITFAPGNRSGGFVSDLTKASKGHEIEPVKIVKGDNFKMQPSFIKIDVEGYELPVLRGLRQTITNHKPIVMFEVHHWCLNAFQRTSLPDFIDQVSDLFPIIYAVEGKSYLDLKDESDRYTFLYHNIVNNNFLDCVGGFDPSQFQTFYEDFER